MTNKPYLTWSEFEKVDMRVGTIIDAYPSLKARKPAYVLHIDFGTLGIKKSSAQITDLYQAKTLIGKQVIAVVNFEAKQIANIMSECLVLGAVGNPDGVILIQPKSKAENGSKIG